MRRLLCQKESRRLLQRSFSSSVVCCRPEEVRGVVRDYGVAYVSDVLDTTSSALLAAELLPRIEAMLEARVPLGIGSRGGFHELTQRSPGRYDMPAELSLERTLDPDRKLRSLAVAALGGDTVPAELAFVGVVVSEPGADAQRWHVDSLHSSAEDGQPPNLVNVFVPLGVEDVLRAAAGPTEFALGSHKLTNHHHSATFGEEIAYQDPRNSPAMLAAPTSTFAPTRWTPRDALVFDDRTLHRGGANRSTHRRFVAYFSYRRSDFEASTHFEAFRSLPKFLAEAPEIASKVRDEFPGLVRKKTGGGTKCVVVADGAGGSQVHESVLDAVRDAMVPTANVGGRYDASLKVGQIVREGRRAFADFFNADDDATIVFGANATTLNVHLANALFFGKRTSSPSFFTTTSQPNSKTPPNVVLSALEHDSNLGLWATFAERAGMEVRVAPVDSFGAVVDAATMVEMIDGGTVVACVGLASNGIGSLNDEATKAVCEAAKAYGAVSFVDAVHSAPHARLDVKDLDCDFCVCSPYKFFGPHVGVLYGRRALLEALSPDKLVVSDGGLPSEENCYMSKWETGTAQFEAIAGATAAVDYLAGLGTRFGGLDPKPNPKLLSLRTHLPPDPLSADVPTPPSFSRLLSEDQVVTRRQLLDAGYAAIAFHEDKLKRRFLKGANAIPKLKVLGHADAENVANRTSTFAVTVDGVPYDALVAELNDNHDIALTGGTHYCTFWEDLFQVPGAARLSFLHYNTLDEIDAVLDALETASNSAFLRESLQRWP